MVWDPNILLAHRCEHPIQQAMLIRPMETGFREAYDRAREAILQPERCPREIAIHQLKEVLVWLQMYGGCFELPRPSSVGAQVRALLSSTPHQTWTAPEIAKHLAMSEATLRRRLQAEKLSLTKILLDLRLSHALVLLQATDKSITQIANEVGYESPSRFAGRFRERFGQPPTAFRTNPR
ncbi:MAG: helix-turn-helix transcriptional regulator [Acidobacteria bacterium]|nr:helix-turn-helix transcriptional regulator [Acidobacteriota bacterium]MBI3426261.1 helix-turn-helix transcriptional regulator [Acidobacteriota bacterium]